MHLYACENVEYAILEKFTQICKNIQKKHKNELKIHKNMKVLLILFPTHQSLRFVINNFYYLYGEFQSISSQLKIRFVS